jgi:hypothetical protein
MFPGSAAVPAASAGEDAGAARNCPSLIFDASLLTRTSNCTRTIAQSGALTGMDEVRIIKAPSKSLVFLRLLG